MKKLISWTTTALALTLVLTACGSTNNNASQQKKEATKPQASAPAPQSLLQQIKTNGTIRIGTEGTYAPFTFHDKSGKLTGFDIEMAEEVTKRMGVKPEFIETKWDGIFAGLDAKRFDMIASEVSIRPDRQEKYDFSDSYIVSKPVLIVHKDNTAIKKFADLKGKKAAETLTSNFAAIAKKNGAEIVQTDGFNQSIDLLVSKRADATLNDGLSFLDLKKQKPDIPLKVVDESTGADVSRSAIMFRKGNKELVDAVNKALTDMQKDGTYLKISKKWFGTDVSK